MSRACLADQTNAYLVVYVMHFVSLGWLFSHWVLDAINMPGWVFQRGPQLRLFYAPGTRLTGPWYTCILVVVTACVTISWTVIIDWYSDALTTLAGTLLAEIIVLGLII